MGIARAIPLRLICFTTVIPDFLHEQITWRRKFVSASEIRDASLTLDDARLAYVAEVSEDGPVHEFEAAVEAVVNGNLAALAVAPKSDTRSRAFQPDLQLDPASPPRRAAALRDR
jgi:hypothetical protein